MRVFSSKHFPTDNVALTALYWSNLEFNERVWGNSQTSERDLKTLRNALEHKFVKIHEYTCERKLQIEEDNFYHISEDILIKDILHLLELVRECIMELVYAIGIEERRRGRSKNTIQLNIYDFDDEWKV